MLSSFHLNLIRPYAPKRRIDWAAADFTLDCFGRFRDPAIHAEFISFSNRDLVTTGIALGFGGAMLMWPLMFPGQFTWWGAIQHRVLGAMAFVIGVALVLTVAAGNFTERRSSSRSVLAILAAIVITYGCSAPDVYFYVHCREIPDYFSSWAPYMNPDPANFIHDCVRVINAYIGIPIATVISIGTFHPVTALALVLLDAFAAYLGYALTPNENLLTAGETVTELVLKIPIFVIGMVIAVVVQAGNYKNIREQFMATVNAYVQAQVTKKRAEDVDTLLCAMVPESALDRLLSGVPVKDETGSATVLFSDMVQFTAWSSVRPTKVVVAMLNTLCIQLDMAATQLGIEKVKTIGDAYWAVSGLPQHTDDHADALVRFAVQMHQFARRASVGHPEWGLVQLRIGIHSGALRGGIFGTSRLSYEVFGDTSEIAELCEKTGCPDRVHITEATRDLLSADFPVEPYSSVEFHGNRIATFLVALQMGAAPGRLRVANPLAVRTTSSSRLFLTTERHSVASDAGSVMTGGRSSQQKAVAVDVSREAERRRAFLQKRMTRAAELETRLEDSESVTERLSRRRWNWVLMTFEDPAVEAEYQAFVGEKLRAVRRQTRGLFLALIVIQLIVAGLDRPARVGTAAWVVLSIALLLNAGLVAASCVDVVPLTVEAIGFFGVIMLDTVGCGLMQDSIVGNDVLYIFNLVQPLVIGGVTAFSYLTTVTLTFVACGIPVWYFTYSSILFANSFFFTLGECFIVILGKVTFEKMLRQQFIEQKVQQHEHAVQRAREQEQRALLESIVPAHVIGPLQQWLETDMEVTKTIASQFERLCVGFLEIEDPSGVEECYGSAAVASDLQWLFDAHVRIDEAIAAQGGAFDKIKTMGNKVMIAGSFREGDTVRDAGLAMLRCTVGLMRSGLRMKAGFHVGEVMGAVLGTERLCFDIFGDTVNVASRVLTTQGEGEALTVSEAFYDSIIAFGPSGSPDSMCEFMFADARARAAKGKGHILVRVVLNVAWDSDSEGFHSFSETGP